MVGGILTGNLALLFDAEHMFTDVMALIVALVAIFFLWNLGWLGGLLGPGLLGHGVRQEEDRAA